MKFALFALISLTAVMLLWERYEFESRMRRAEALYAEADRMEGDGAKFQAAHLRRVADEMVGWK